MSRDSIIFFMKKIAITIILFLTIINITGCKYNTPLTVHEADGYYFNTYVNVKLYGCGNEILANEAVEICDYYEDIFSRTLDKSLMFTLNENGNIAIDSEETLILARAITESLEYSDMTNGALDITIEPVSALWNFSQSDMVVPSGEEVLKAVSKVDYRKPDITDESIELNGTRLDMGAVAKGFVADRIKEFLTDNNVTSALINLGGNVLCVGNKPDGKDFVIGIQKPFSQDNLLGVQVDGLSVVTSGVYERYFEENGVRYHHILNPDTGMPCNNELLSVTIISESSFAGDCLSTGCFVLGMEQGMELVESLDGVYAIFVDKDYKIYYSEGAEALVKKG